MTTDNPYEALASPSPPPKKKAASAAAAAAPKCPSLPPAVVARGEEVDGATKKKKSRRRRRGKSGGAGGGGTGGGAGGANGSDTAAVDATSAPATGAGAAEVNEGEGTGRQENDGRMQLEQQQPTPHKKNKGRQRGGRHRNKSEGVDSTARQGDDAGVAVEEGVAGEGAAVSTFTAPSLSASSSSPRQQGPRPPRHPDSPPRRPHQSQPQPHPQPQPQQQTQQQQPKHPTNQGNRQHSPSTGGHHRGGANKKPLPIMTVIVHRVNLKDGFVAGKCHRGAGGGGTRSRAGSGASSDSGYSHVSAAGATESGGGGGSACSDSVEGVMSHLSISTPPPAAPQSKGNEGSGNAARDANAVDAVMRMVVGPPPGFASLQLSNHNNRGHSTDNTDDDNEEGEKEEEDDQLSSMQMTHANSSLHDDVAAEEYMRHHREMVKQQKQQQQYQQQQQQQMLQQQMQQQMHLQQMQQGGGGMGSAPMFTPHHLSADATSWAPPPPPPHMLMMQQQQYPQQLQPYNQQPQQYLSLQQQQQYMQQQMQPQHIQQFQQQQQQQFCVMNGMIMPYNDGSNTGNNGFFDATASPNGPTMSPPPPKMPHPHQHPQQQLQVPNQPQLQQAPQEQHQAQQNQQHQAQHQQQQNQHHQPHHRKRHHHNHHHPPTSKLIDRVAPFSFVPPLPPALVMPAPQRQVSVLSNASDYHTAAEQSDEDEEDEYQYRDENLNHADEDVGHGNDDRKESIGGGTATSTTAAGTGTTTTASSGAGMMDSFFDDFVSKPPSPPSRPPERKKKTRKKKKANGGHQKQNVAVVRSPVPGKALLSPYAEKTNASTRSYGGADVPNPHDPNVVHDKYWAQRRRLFSRFDEGILLDSEGWYSVTPETIADHVAARFGEMANSSMMGTMGVAAAGGGGIVILDAFCGCGGNAIAFGKLPPELVSLIVCVDVDRSKLKMAAYNAALYGIPGHKLRFIEANSIAVMDQCYHNGNLAIEHAALTQQSSHTAREEYAGFMIGGIELLPVHIDAIFMDPPWGGINYELMGKNGYDLERDMKIQYKSSCFQTSLSGQIDPSSQISTVIDGIKLVQIAAAASSSKLVAYDLPRNTNKNSLGLAALSAGYQGNVKLEEHYLNGRLKTVTAYFGQDFRSLLLEKKDDD